MTDHRKLVLALDIYGTILDTGNITSGIRTHIQCSDETATQLSQLWRRYQLEYTWRLNSIGFYEPFDVVTRNSLKHASAETGLALSNDTIEMLMNEYNHLSPYGDVVQALEELNRLENVELMIFSNGTEEMVSTALHASLPQALLPLPLYLVDAVKRYKPATEVYDGLANKVKSLSSSNGDRADIWLVSGNPFDVTGARAAGLGAFWVDRAAKGWTDQLPLPLNGTGPLKIVHSLSDLAAVVESMS